MQTKEKKEKAKELWELGYKTIIELESGEGILASSREELFGAIFGRDSLITALKLLEVYKIKKDKYFLSLVMKIIFGLARLQGREINVESGEEPGKCIHEYRRSNHDRLTKAAKKPWYVYPDGEMRNYDSVDSTPLYLITCYRYYQLSKDKEFLIRILPSIEMALLWLLDCGDYGKNGVLKCLERNTDDNIFIDYEMNSLRKHGGLLTQGWMDSADSVFHEDGTEVKRPINPVEVQSYSYLALRLWARHFEENNDKIRSESINSRALKLKEEFNKKFIIEVNEEIVIPFAIDGTEKPLISPRSSIGHLLWASLNKKNDGFNDSILENKYLPKAVERLMKKDLFVPEAGFRTLSSLSHRYNPNSYHNGSIWPHDTAIAAEGLEKLGFLKEAEASKEALFQAFLHFKTPLELFVYDNDYKEYTVENKPRATKKQAWSAAAMLWVSASFS